MNANESTRKFVEKYVRPRDGDRVLDVGCGDGDIRPLLGDVHYLGIDDNERYLKVASSRTNATTRFVRANVADLESLDVGTFDIVIALGLLHHLPDDSAQSLLAGVRSVLSQGGRLVTLDPVFSADQKSLARVLAALDRGRHVRDEAGYLRLVEEDLTVTQHSVRHDLLWFPYSHCTIEACSPN